MGTVKQTLDIARSEIGTKEYPKGSNNVKYNDWYWGKGQYEDWAAWCLVFLQYVCAKAGVKLPVRSASCGEFMRDAQDANMWVKANFKRGDIVFYDWSGKQNVPAHCGIVESIIPDYGVIAIEGNTSVSNNSNGGEVMRRKRPSKYIVGAVRPVYDAENEQEDIFKMTIDEFINRMTDKQAYALLSKAQKYTGTLSEPDWSKKEGNWDKAKKKGVINGGNPEGLIKRDEVVAMFGRTGLLD